MGILSGKRALIVGVVSDRSIAYGIAEAMRSHGAELAFTYASEKLKDRVQPLADACGAKILLPMDVTIDAEVDAVFAHLGKTWGSLDILVHAVAFAPREALAGGFTESTSREAFRIAHDVSSYSLTQLARGAAPLMEGRAGAILTLSYLGAVKSVPSYNVMGLAKASLEANVRFLAADLGPRNIRVNGISAGPIKTLAAAGIGGFRRMLNHVAQVAPLRRNVSTEDVGKAATFLCSDMASGVTGEILYVDAGFSTVGMGFPEGDAAGG
jgi:enoyl-[acyl-carrier protein] reductase I